MRIELFAPMETVRLDTIQPGQCFRLPNDGSNAIRLVTDRRRPDCDDDMLTVSLTTGQTSYFRDNILVTTVAAKVVPL